jgi:DNA-binding PadR family transcriptional regulator
VPGPSGGLIQAEWRATENKRRAKFYALTGAADERLAHEAREWTRLSSAVALIMRAEEA